MTNYFWEGGDYECAFYAITSSNKDPSNELKEKEIEYTIANNSMDLVGEITDEECETLKKFIKFSIHDLRSKQEEREK